MVHRDDELASEDEKLVVGPNADEEGLGDSEFGSLDKELGLDDGDMDGFHIDTGEEDEEY